MPAPFAQGYAVAGFGLTVVPGESGYFSEGRVACRSRIVNDVFYPEGQHGPDQVSNFPNVWQAGGGGMMVDPPDPSATQGLGKSPGAQWAHMPISMGVNPALPFDAVFDDTTTPLPLEPAPRGGWALMGPSGHGGYEPTLHPFPVPIGEPAPIADARSQSWTEAVGGP